MEKWKKSFISIDFLSIFVDKCMLNLIEWKRQKKDLMGKGKITFKKLN